MKELANAMKAFLAQAFSEMNARFRAAAGGGADDAIEFEKELRESGFAGTTYFAWARRTAQRIMHPLLGCVHCKISVCLFGF
jgi:hypothetical protein